MHELAATGFTFFAGRLAFGALIDWRGIAAAGQVIAVSAIATAVSWIVGLRLV